MARINLLPWRETLRKKRQRDFALTLLAGILVAAGVMLAWHMIVEAQIRHQQKRNDFLRSEIAALDIKIKEIQELEKTKAQIINRMEVIQRLQASRPAIVHMMDELVSTLPEGLFLVQFKQSTNLLTFDGRAQSNARVSSYMRNIDKSPWLDNPDLRFIENKERTGTGFSHFQLNAQNLSQRRDKPK